MPDLLALIAVLAGTVFTGAALYIDFVEQPARLECATAIAARQWAPSYRRATIMQASLAIIVGAAGLAPWLFHRGAVWGYGALLILAVVPVTLIIIFPTNKRLLEPGRDLASAETRVLLVRWRRLHAIRSILGLAASPVYASALGLR